MGAGRLWLTSTIRRHGAIGRDRHSGGRTSCRSLPCHGDIYPALCSWHDWKCPSTHSRRDR
eukprot:9423273-Pyramimonas_sp.AAC.1